MRKKKMRIVSSAMTFCMVSSLALSHVSLAQGTDGTIPANTETAIEGEAQPGVEGNVEDTTATNNDQTVVGGGKEDTIDKEDTTEEEQGTEKEEAETEDKKDVDETDATKQPAVDEPSTFQTELPVVSTEDAATYNWVNLGEIEPAKNELADGWRLIEANTANLNDTNAAYFMGENAKSFEDGYIEATISADSISANTRTGFAVRWNKTEGKPNCVFVGYDDYSGWFYQIFDGIKDDYHASTPKQNFGDGKAVTLKVQVTGDTMNAFLDGEVLFENVDISTAPDSGLAAIKVGGWKDGENTILRAKDIHYTGQAVAVQADVTGTVVDEEDNPLVATVTVGDKTVKTGEDGAFKISLPDNENYTLTVSKDNYETYTSDAFSIKDAKDQTLGTIKLKARVGDLTTISSEEMEVTVDKNFPRVVKYNMKGDLADKEFLGQESVLDKVTINGVDVVPTVKSDVTSDKVTYEMTLVDEENDINAVINAELVVKKNTVEFNITNIEDKKIVKTIEIKNHNLLSVNSGQTKAVLDGAVMSTNTRQSGDVHVEVDGNLKVDSKDGYMYAFLSNSDLSAGLWSNSENSLKNTTVIKGLEDGDWRRVTATAKDVDGKKVMGLSSTYWTYQKSEDHRKEDGIIEYKNKDGAIEIAELPSVKVAIAGDINKDGEVDWNDGAIAYREIMNNPVGSEKVPDLVAYRIAMNFSGQAQNPFLMTLDNVKKVNLSTDGLGQSILLKGYGSEGHDSGHLNYADIGTRIGGAEDMKTLLEKGKLYGATFGIHVNASETYPESKYFSEEILMPHKSGRYSYGWNWLDQGININADYDLRNGRVDRWKELYDVLDGEKNNLDFIYVDVWGNGQSGDNGTWASRQLAKEITGLGWRLAGEWGYANEYDSTFQHWAADLTYGGYSLQGINSRITRFIRNHQKDSWVGNTPSYGGEAETPLLGGYDMTDFEGWRGRADYAAYINNLFEVNLASKYIQHFTVSDWEDGKTIQMTHGGQTYNWTPGMKAVLDNDTFGKLTVTRQSNNHAEETDLYRTRVMELNDVKIYEGRKGNTKYLIPWFWDCNGNDLVEADQKLYHWNTNGGESTWTLPDGWNADSLKIYKLSSLGKSEVTDIVRNNGDGTITITAEAQTAYTIYKKSVENNLDSMNWSEGMHIIDSGFNSGSLKQWDIKGSNVNIENSQGANPMLTFRNEDGQSTATQKLTDLEAGKSYAVYVGIDNRSKAEAKMTVKADGKEIGSNSSGISIAKNYVSAYAHNTDDKVATVDNTSYFQNMYVFFTVPNNVNDITLTLSREAGEGATYFDDIRVCETEAKNWEEWESKKEFKQDFEDVVQGVYPFVVGNLEKVTDNRTHLAEKHKPFTQKGWNMKEVSDVIEGDWSLKTNGLAQYNNLVYQTVPHNFKFEKGKSYMISFKYEAGSDNTYAFVTGDGAYEQNGVNTKVGLDDTIAGINTYEKHDNANAGTDETHPAKTFTYNFVAPKDSDLGWIGIFSTDVPADRHGWISKNDQEEQETQKNKQSNFNGYADFVLDNLVIKEVDTVKTDLYDAIAYIDTQIEEFYTTDSWNALLSTIEEAKKVYDNFDATQAEIDAMIQTLTKAIDGLEEKVVTKEVLKGIVDRCAEYQRENFVEKAWREYVIIYNYANSALNDASASQKLLDKAYKDLILAEMELKKNPGENIPSNDGSISSDKFEVKAGNAHPGEGPELAVDNDEGTVWHTSWGGAALADSWFEFTFNEPQLVTGFKYLPRLDGRNGKITEYKIQISKDNGTTYEDVATGTWDINPDWKTVSFDKEIEDVTNVKLLPLATIGDTPDTFTSAAELKVLGTLKAEQDAPTGIKVVDSTEGKPNGKITGVTTAMEYSKSVNGSYIACTGTEITGLEAGDYYVRYAETDTLKDSLPTKVTVFGDVVEPTPDPDATPNPDATPKPTPNPDVTIPPVEVPTSGPSETTAPQPTTAPDATATPAPTEAPDATATPVPTEKPQEDLLEKVKVSANRNVYFGGSKNTATVNPKIPSGLTSVKEFTGDESEVIFSYSSSNTKIVTVSNRGKLTAKKTGSAVVTVTAKLASGETKTWKQTVTVKKASLEFTKSASTIGLGKKATFTVALYGYNKSDIVWSTTKKDKAAVAKNKGKVTVSVTGKTAGKDTVVVTVKNNKGKDVTLKKAVTVK